MLLQVQLYLPEEIKKRKRNFYLKTIISSFTFGG
jgi:hypothetical protein